jgi:hypothetical protein
MLSFFFPFGKTSSGLVQTSSKLDLSCPFSFQQFTSKTLPNFSPPLKQKNLNFQVDQQRKFHIAIFL